MEVHTIQAAPRGDNGKGAARRLRATGKIPAVVYGKGGAASQVSIDPKALLRLRKSPLGFNQPVAITVDGGDDVALAMLKEVQKHPTRRTVLHADFHALDADQKIVVDVPFQLKGKSKGVELGGKLSQPLRSAKVRCKAADIPARIVIDISDLDVGDKVLLSSLPLPANVEPGWRYDATVLMIARGRGKS